MSEPLLVPVVIDSVLWPGGGRAVVVLTNPAGNRELAIPVHYLDYGLLRAILKDKKDLSPHYRAIVETFEITHGKPKAVVISGGPMATVTFSREDGQELESEIRVGTAIALVHHFEGVIYLTAKMAGKLEPKGLPEDIKPEDFRQ